MVNIFFGQMPPFLESDGKIQVKSAIFQFIWQYISINMYLSGLLWKKKVLDEAQLYDWIVTFLRASLVDPKK